MNLKHKVYATIIKRNWYRPRRVFNAALSVLLPNSISHVAGPISIDIEPTLACNLSCIMCHRKELAKRRKHMTMDFEMFKRIIDQMPTLLKVTLQGMGEPFLAKDLFKMAQYARKKGAVVVTVTNGNVFDKEKIAHAVSCGIDRIYVSIDSLDSDQYRAYRPGGDLDVVKRNVRALMKKRNGVKSSLAVGIWMLLFEDNIDQLIPMIAFAKQAGVDELIVNTGITYRGKKHWKKKITAMDSHRSDTMESALHNAAAHAKKEGISFRITSGVGALKPTAQSRCQWPWKALYVTSEGDVSPCCIIADPYVAGMGNILESGFGNVWNGKAYRKLRTGLAHKKIPEYCKGCYEEQ